MPTSLAAEKLKKLKKAQAIVIQPHVDMSTVACIILGGGKGSRLFPLTTNRCKPALCFGGRYRLIDIPLSNTINSGISKIFVVTQFLSTSIHRHVNQTYQLGPFSNGFIDLLAAEEKLSHHVSYQGTADAVRQNLSYFAETAADYFLILSGDQVYNFDFKKMVAFAQKTDADMVISALPIDAKNAQRMGILKIDSNHTITDFHEKPQDKKILQQFAFDKSSTPYLGSMGIYLFKRKAMFNLLQNDPREDFGRHLIPNIVSRGSTAAYIHEGYWEDIGTIESFYKANMALTLPDQTIDLYNEKHPIFSCKYNLPGPKITNTMISDSILCEGVRCQGYEISHSILGPRTVIEEGSIIKNSYLMGNDFYHPPTADLGHPPSIKIGRHCHLDKVVLDKNVSLGDNVVLTNPKKIQHYDGDGIYIRDGIIVVTRGYHVPSNTIL